MYSVSSGKRHLEQRGKCSFTLHGQSTRRCAYYHESNAVRFRRLRLHSDQFHRNGNQQHYHHKRAASASSALRQSKAREANGSTGKRGRSAMRNEWRARFTSQVDQVRRGDGSERSSSRRYSEDRQRSDLRSRSLRLSSNWTHR